MNLAEKQINHPGRKNTLQYINCHFVAATPPSKGGETDTPIYYYKITLSLMTILRGKEFLIYTLCQ